MQPKFKLDEIDHQILDMLIDNTRIPFTDIAKKLFISAGTVHVRVKKMEDAGLIKGSSLILDYNKLGYSFIAYVGIYLEKTSQLSFLIERINIFGNNVTRESVIRNQLEIDEGDPFNEILFKVFLCMVASFVSIYKISNIPSNTSQDSSFSA